MPVQTIVQRVLRGPVEVADLDLGSVRLDGCTSIGTSIDPVDWPTVRRVRVERLDLRSRTAADGTIFEDCEVRDVRTRGAIILMAPVFRRVVLSGPVQSIAIRQYGYVATANEVVCPYIRAATGDEWALDIRGMVPTGHVEMSLVVDPWQVACSPTYHRLLSRESVPLITDEVIAFVQGHDSLAAMNLVAICRHEFLRTQLLSSTTPNPVWFDYLDNLGIPWAPSEV